MEHHTFKAEINELMNMIIHNFYSNNDIFLRELISNSSDALNKIKFNSLTDKNLLQGNHDFNIKIKVNKEEKTITIEDSGIGMSKEDLINNLGTIAKSGTKEFIKKLSQSEQSENKDLIGQFGVGFYSAYLVAKNIRVITRLAGTNDTYVWESSANGTFTLDKLDEDVIPRGTQITLFIKEDSEDYLSETKITDIIKKHSSYITYPILLYKLISREEDILEEDNILSESNVDNIPELVSEVPELISEVTDEVHELVSEVPELISEVPEVTELISELVSDEVPEKSNLKVEDVNDSDDEAYDETKILDSIKPKKTRTVNEESWEKINIEPLWCRNSADISPEEYQEFYKNISGSWDKYLTLKHFKVEGGIELTGLLYIPMQAPHDLFNNTKEKKNGIKLYVKKVLITDTAQELYPEWMNFVKGLIDSSDLQLNASRELLQNTKVLKQINKSLVKKCIELLSELSDDEDKYQVFYDNFDKNIKLGVHEEKDGNRDKLIELLRYTTSKGEMVCFEKYVSQMKESQQGIYFITGENITTLENSPFIDKLKKNDYEIIYMIDPLDEYIIQSLTKYKDHKLINVTKDDLQLSENKVEKDEYKELCKKMKDVLGDKINNVIISDKIESQPAIVTNPMGMSANMERILKAQALASKNNNPMQNMMFSQKNLEINPEHNLIKKIDTLEDNTELINIVYESALLSGGYQLDDINSFLKKMYKYMN